MRRASPTNCKFSRARHASKRPHASRRRARNQLLINGPDESKQQIALQLPFECMSVSVCGFMLALRCLLGSTCSPKRNRSPGRRSRLSEMNLCRGHNKALLSVQVSFRLGRRLTFSFDEHFLHAGRYLTGQAALLPTSQVGWLHLGADSLWKDDEQDERQRGTQSSVPSSALLSVRPLAWSGAICMRKCYKCSERAGISLAAIVSLVARALKLGAPHA